MFPPNVWYAIRQTAIVVLLALGFGIGFAMVTCCAGCADDPLPPCPPNVGCICTRAGRCSCDGVVCQRAPVYPDHPDARRADAP